jgi:hypothetical protein
MCKRKVYRYWSLVLLAALLCWLGTAQAVAQTEPTPPPDEVETPDEVEATDPAEGTANAANPPRYITEIRDAGLLTQEQISQMRADGLGWGEIRIAVRLAERISADSEGKVTYADALAGVLQERAAGKGFGEIAGEHNLKVGQLIDKGGKGGPAGQQGVQAGQTRQTTEKKQGIFARLGRALGFGKKERVTQDAAAAGDAGRIRKIDRAQKVERMERPAKPEKQERSERPQRPEKPERGPKR